MVALAQIPNCSVSLSPPKNLLVYILRYFSGVSFRDYVIKHNCAFRKNSAVRISKAKKECHILAEVLRGNVLIWRATRERMVNVHH